MSKKARVRPAVAEDFQAVYPLLQQLNNTRFTREIWQRLFRNLWQAEDWFPGYVLETDKEIVGFLGCIASEQIVSGKRQRIINITSWIVQEQYRSSSILLLLPLLKQKDITLTSLTSSSESYRVYKQLGFQDLESSVRVIYPWWPARNGFNLVSDKERVLGMLNPAVRDHYIGHQELPVEQFCITYGREYCFFIVTNRLGRGHVQYISNLTFFRLRTALLTRMICSHLTVKSIQVDERFLMGKWLLFSRKKKLKQGRQYKSEMLPATAISGIWSELVILAN